MLQMQASYVACGFGKPANVRVLELLDRLQCDPGWLEGGALVKKWRPQLFTRARLKEGTRCLLRATVETRVDTCTSPRKA